MIKFFVSLWIRIRTKIRKEKKIPFSEFKTNIRSMTKAQIIDELIYQSSRINKNEGQFKSRERRELRKNSKRKLERALILLKLYENKQLRKTLEPTMNIRSK